MDNGQGGLRIMFMANAPWAATGYGVQGKHLAPRLQKLGHEMAYFAFYGLQGAHLNLNNISIYPRGNHPWGQDVLNAHMGHFQADLLITLMDVWVANWMGEHARKGGYLWCPWTPIDYNPMPEAVEEALQGAHLILPYSRWGEEQLRQADHHNVRYIPHGVDTSVFKPMSRELARRRLGLPEDAFIIGMVAANKDIPPRKAFTEQLLAFAKFKRKVPNALLYLHTWRYGDQRGVDFDKMLPAIGLRWNDDVLITDEYRYLMGMPEEWMATLYNAMDVYSGTSMGEGFGIPYAEAQACGIPVINAANTSQPEMNWSGIVVKKQYPFWAAGINSWRYYPDVDEIAEAYGTLHEALQSDEASNDIQQRAVRGAQDYDYDWVVQRYWVPLLNELALSLDVEPIGERHAVAISG